MNFISNMCHNTPKNIHNVELQVEATSFMPEGRFAGKKVTYKDRAKNFLTSAKDFILNNKVKTGVIALCATTVVVVAVCATYLSSSTTGNANSNLLSNTSLINGTMPLTNETIPSYNGTTSTTEMLTQTVSNTLDSLLNTTTGVDANQKLRNFSSCYPFEGLEDKLLKCTKKSIPMDLWQQETSDLTRNGVIYESCEAKESNCGFVGVSADEWHKMPKVTVANK